MLLSAQVERPVSYSQNELLNRGQKVKVIVRSPDRLPIAIRNHDNLSVLHASLLDISDAVLAQHVKGCDAVASCLGHNMDLKGLYGPKGVNTPSR